MWDNIGMPFPPTSSAADEQPAPIPLKAPSKVATPFEQDRQLADAAAAGKLHGDEAAAEVIKQNAAMIERFKLIKEQFSQTPEIDITKDQDFLNFLRSSISFRNALYVLDDAYVAERPPQEESAAAPASRPEHPLVAAARAAGLDLDSETAE